VGVSSVTGETLFGREICMYGWILGTMFFLLGIWEIRQNYKPSYGWGEKEIRVGNELIAITFGFSLLCFALAYFGGF
jgi:hypothetical protein